MILVSIAVLFRPSNMASRYAYAAVGTMDEEDEDLTTLEMAARGDAHGSSSPAAATSKALVDDYADDEDDARRFQKEQAEKDNQ